MSNINLNNTYVNRKEINERINKLDVTINNFFHNTFLEYYSKEGCLGVITKHLIGLSVSIHKDCFDGVRNHLESLHDLNTSIEIIEDVLSQCIVDGGSLMYPKIRKVLLIINTVYGKYEYEI